MDVQEVLLRTYRKWSDETLLRAMSTFSKPGGVANRPYMQVLRERGLSGSVTEATSIDDAANQDH